MIIRVDINQYNFASTEQRAGSKCCGLGFMDLRYLAIIFIELFVSSYCQRCHICLVNGFMKFSVCCSISMFCVTSCIRSLDIHVRVKQLFIFLTNSKGELLTSEHLMLSVIKSY